MVNRPFPVNPVHTAISISYRNPRLTLIADEVLPRVMVGASKFSWTFLPVEQAFSVPRTEVGRLGRVERVEFRGQEREGGTRDFALEDAIPFDDIRDAEAMRANGLGTFDPVTIAVEWLTDLILVDREVRAAATLQDPNNYAPNNRIALSGDNQLSHPDCDVIGTLKAAFDKTLIFRPNTMTMGREVWSALSSNPQLVNAVKGNVSSKGIIKPDEFVSLFEGEGLKKLNIGEAFINTARKGQTPVLSRVWGNSISLTYINPAARPEQGATFGFTAQWQTRLAGSWEDKNVGMRGGTVVRVGESVKEIVCAPEAGYIIQNPVAPQ